MLAGDAAPLVGRPRGDHLATEARPLVVSARAVLDALAGELAGVDVQVVFDVLVQTREDERLAGATGLDDGDGGFLREVVRVRHGWSSSGSMMSESFGW